MSKISCDKSRLINFFKLVCLKDDVENSSGLLNFKEKELTTAVMSSDRSLALVAHLKGTFEPYGEAGLKNIPLFIKFLESLDNEFKMEFLKNQIKLTSKKTTIKVPIKTADYILNKLDLAKFDAVFKASQGYSFNLPKAVLKEIVDKFNIVEGPAVILSAKGGSIYLNVKNVAEEVEMDTEIEVESLPKDIEFEIKISKNLIDLFSSITQDVKVSLAKENPSSLHIHAEGDGYSFDYLLALMEKEEQAAPKKKEKASVEA